MNVPRKMVHWYRNTSETEPTTREKNVFIQEEITVKVT